MRSVVVCLCLCLAVWACSPGSSPEPQPRTEVAAQERVWEGAGLANYRFDFQQQCFCVREQVQPVVIEVRDGRIDRVVAKESGIDLSDEPGLRWYTVADLFDRVAEAEANGSEPLVVRYDAELGYPTHVEIGGLAADAGVIYTASNLEPL